VAEGTTVEDRRDLCLHASDPARPVRGRRPLEGDEPPGGVVEVRDRLVQRRSRQVRDLAKEVAEGSRRRPGLRRVLRTLGRPRALDPDEESPDLAVRIPVVGGAVPRRDQPQPATLGLRHRYAGETGGHVVRQAHHVLHHLLRLAEDEAVDVLEQEPAEAPGAVPRRQPGVVDVAPGLGLERDETPLDGEVAGDRFGRRARG
jgi:hypothetical protein